MTCPGKQALTGTAGSSIASIFPLICKPFLIPVFSLCMQDLLLTIWVGARNRACC